ncbi:MAG TPA: MlaD family protein [Bacteroidales bacterium]|nr:MlaD family protein [Bacteroidales bacterium]
MKKISNEVKVGATALITIIVFIWLYNFLKGKDFFSSTAKYYVVYNKIGGLAESSPVEVNGYKVGVVQSIRFLDSSTGRLLVVLTVDKGFELPVNTVAEITTASLIAGMKIQFVYGNGPGTYLDGDTIPGRLSQSIITKVETELLPLKDRLTKLINVLDSVITSVNDIMDPQFKKNLNLGIASLSNTAKSIDEVIGSKEAELKATLDNINKFTRMLADNSNAMSGTLSNLEAVTDTLVSADIYQSVRNLKSSLENASVLIENLNNGKGTAGKLMTNDSLYTNLSNSLESLNQLLQDMKANPKRYVHFSLFGKKNIPSD